MWIATSFLGYWQLPVGFQSANPPTKSNRYFKMHHAYKIYKYVYILDIASTTTQNNTNQLVLFVWSHLPAVFCCFSSILYQNRSQPPNVGSPNIWDKAVSCWLDLRWQGPEKKKQRCNINYHGNQQLPSSLGLVGPIVLGLKKPFIHRFLGSKKGSWWPRTLTCPLKIMVGRCIPYWNNPFSKEHVSFGGCDYHGNPQLPSSFFGVILWDPYSFLGLKTEKSFIFPMGFWVQKKVYLVRFNRHPLDRISPGRSG